MKNLLFLIVLAATLSCCKNNGQGSATAKVAETKKTKSTVKNIVVDGARKVASKPDFQVLEMSNKADVLTVIVRYSGGCEEHDFNAYFSGGWLKSLPPQAVLNFEHLNPKNDACRSLVKDTLLFNLQPLRYAAGKEVVVKWSENTKIQTRYIYGK